MNIAKIRTMDISNGPGIRASVFVSGCRNNCRGCFNKEAQDFNYGEKYSENIEKRIFKILENEHIQGLSILGGEPLDLKNQEGVLALIVKVKEKFPQKDIWLWSGYTIENLISREDPITTKILNKIDYIVDGPFIEELKNPSLEFRGSSNQRIINTSEYFLNKNIDFEDRLVIFKQELEDTKKFIEEWNEDTNKKITLEDVGNLYSKHLANIMFDLGYAGWYFEDLGNLEDMKKQMKGTLCDDCDLEKEQLNKIFNEIDSIEEKIQENEDSEEDLEP